MKKLSIYREKRSEEDHSVVLEKETLRVVNLHPTFQGLGDRGINNNEEFKKLADALEPTNTGWALS